MNKTIYLKGPMRTFTTIIWLPEDTAMKKIITKIIYYQNSLSIFGTPLINQIKMASDKTYTEEINLNFIRKNMGFFFNSAW